jgi:hypothetical protein
MKDTYYFPHDYHARHDPKLEKLRMEVGPVADGIFWDIVEMLYEEGGYLSIKDIPLYSKMLNTNEQMFNKLVTDLFLIDGERFYNQSLLDRLDHIRKVREERRSAGKASGKSRKKNICSTSDEHLSNNIKESKGNKVNNIVSIFYEPFCSKYPKPVNTALALPTFRELIKTEQEANDLMTALNNYKQSDEVKKGFIKNCDNWLQEWNGWLLMKPKTEYRLP